MSFDSRSQILSNLRSALPQSAPLPSIAADSRWLSFDQVFHRFTATLAAVGGHCVRVQTAGDANAALQDVAAWRDATIRCSLVEGIGDSTLDVRAVTDPHDLQNVGFAVLPGEFAVAENGAIWVTDETVPHRVLYFLPQHLAIVLPATQIVHNMHEAYERIQPERHAFSGFISGPSKTADIEQSLVIGAHGARSLTVLAID